uniref:Uncharacterized protein n=1 Tax=Pristionchus pacificus TaxID=54126 RepID=A0A2A6CSV0_PRIPA|eukprot:PDM81190.1 hypothetical protein PRIPAC_36193 [Pristionchus pacificus]
MVARHLKIHTPLNVFWICLITVTGISTFTWTCQIERALFSETHAETSGADRDISKGQAAQAA